MKEIHQYVVFSNAITYSKYSLIKSNLSVDEKYCCRSTFTQKKIDYLLI